jgi:prepilin-type N-terminal cleavage/methylation domain-containing protein
MTICHSPCSVARRRSAQGFTIIEVMMASVILVVGFMGMIQAISLGSEMLATARRQTLAAQILEHEIGKLRLTNWSGISGLADYNETNYTTLSPDDTRFDTAISASGVTYKLARDVTAITTDLVEVTFTLSWTATPSSAAAARTYIRKSTAFFGKYGLNNSIQRS